MNTDTHPAGPTPRVVQLESGGWGGLAHYVYNLGQALAADGCEVTLQTQAPFELEEMPRDFALRAFDKSTDYAGRWRAVRATLRETKTSILHVQSTISARRDWLHLARLRMSGTRLVVTAHNVMPHEKAEREAFGMRFAFARIYGMADAVIVHGDNTRSQLLGQFGPAPRRVHVIPHGDYGFATGRHDRSEARAGLGIDADNLVLLAFGAMRDYKGIPDLIEAFSRVAEQFPAARLLIVGKPIRVDVDAYRRQIREAGLQERITVRDEYVPFEDIGLYFAAADIGVYPYRAINQSGALQLAYGAALPVVATAVGELATSVRDGDNGILAPPSDPAAFAEALRDMMSRDAPTRAAMGERSRQLAGENHSWAEAAAATNEIYRSLSTSG